MNRAVSGLLLIATAISMLEVPSCGTDKKDGMRGVSPSPGHTPTPRQIEINPPKTRDDRKRKVQFEATWREPDRRVLIRWELGSRKFQQEISQSPFMWLDDGGAPGERAMLIVHQMGGSGFLECKIKVDGRLPTVAQGSRDNPMMFRNDNGNCYAVVTIS